MFVEAIDQILAIWAGEAPYDIKGKFWNISTVKTNWPEVGIGSIVKPYQKPHPLIVGTASDPESKGVIALGRARLGAGVVEPAARQLPGEPLGELRQGRGGGRPQGRPRHLARGALDLRGRRRATARAYGGDDAKSPYRFYMRQLLMKLGRAKRSARSRPPGHADEEVTLDYVVENIIIRGTVNAVVDASSALHETVGDFGTLLYCGKDWTDPALGRRSMELMAEKVMPAVNAALGRRVAAE